MGREQRGRGQEGLTALSWSHKQSTRGRDQCQGRYLYTLDGFHGDEGCDPGTHRAGAVPFPPSLEKLLRLGGG